MSQIHPARLRQQRQSVNPNPRRLADCSATDLILQANRESRLASEVLNDHQAAKRAERWEFAGNLFLIGLGLVVAYCAVVGAVHTLIGMGVGA